MNSPAFRVAPCGLLAAIRAIGGQAAGRAAANGLSRLLGPTAGGATACLLTGYCSSIWGDGTRDHPSHQDEADALGITGAESCEEIAWAIRVLKVATEWRKGNLRPEDSSSDIGRGHKRRIEMLERHLRHLEAVYAAKCSQDDAKCDR